MLSRSLSETSPLLPLRPLTPSQSASASFRSIVVALSPMLSNSDRLQRLPSRLRGCFHRSVLQVASHRRYLQLFSSHVCHLPFVHADHADHPCAHRTFTTLVHGFLNVSAYRRASKQWSLAQF